MLSFRGKLHEVLAWPCLSQRDSIWKRFLLGGEFGDAIGSLLDLLVDLLLGGGESAHRRGAALEVIDERCAIGFLDFAEVGARLAKLLVDGLARGIGNRTVWVVGFDLIIGERIDQELLTHVLE